MNGMRAALCCVVCLLSLPLVAMGAGSPTRLGVLWWPADPGDAANPFVRSFRDCLVDRLAGGEPDLLIFPEQSVRDALFPLMEPATQPKDGEAFAALLARPEVKARLRKHIDFLVAFSGGTREDFHGGVLCGAGYGGGGCFGLAWVDKGTRIDVVIWDIEQAAPAQSPTTRVEGTTWIPALLLPVPLPARTEAEACRDMARQVRAFVDSCVDGRGCR